MLNYLKIAACVSLLSLSGAVGAEVAIFTAGENAERLGYPFSEAVRVGDMLYLSGQIGTVPGENGLIAGGIEAETRQTLANIRNALRRQGLSTRHVVKCTVFMADMAEWPKLNKIYAEVFRPNFPARSALAASGLALDARVEIECIAAFPGRNQARSEEEAKVRDVIRLYAEGTFEGSREKLTQSFHNKAVMNGHLAGDLVLATPEPFIANMQSAPLSDVKDSDYQWEITSISVSGKVAAVVLEESGFPGGLRFTNYFHLIDDGTGWKIISKAFSSHP